MFFWNSKKTTYYDSGKRAYDFGDKIPVKAVVQMGKETFDEYVEKGLIVDGTPAGVAKSEKKANATSPERDILFTEAESLGLKPHYRAGVDKLKAMIADAKALLALKEEALTLGIDPSDDVTFEELTTLVDEKKAEPGKKDESDS